MIRQVFYFMIFSSSTVLGQIKVTGFVKDMLDNPIRPQYIHLNKQSIVYPDSIGYFEASTSSDSLVLVFRVEGYKMKKVKIYESKNIVVRLKATYSSVAGDAIFDGKSQQPLSKIENERGTMETYSIDTIALLDNTIRSKKVVWQLGRFKVLLPLDSLVDFLNIVPYRPADIQYGIEYLKAHSKKGKILLSKKFLRVVGTHALNDFAIEMISEKSIEITDDSGAFIKQLILKDIFWNGYPKCSGCCWGGLQFLPGKSDFALFTRTSLIC